MSQTRPTKAKRRLKDISFDHEGSHLALTSKSQGGAASLQNKMFCTKSTAQFTDEFIEKAQKIRVTMELPDFLEKFFGLYDEQADVLAQMMGYEPETEDSENAEEIDTYECDYFWHWWKERLPEGTDPYMVEPTEADYQAYIDAKLQGVEILMSLREHDTLTEGLSKLNQEQYLSMLSDQSRIEKALEYIDKGYYKKKTKKSKSKTVRDYSDGMNSTSVAKSSNESTDASKSDTSTVIEKQSEETMSKENAQAPVTDKELVEKSQFEAVQKALEEQKELLNKALEQVKAYEQEKKEAVKKARFAHLQTVVKDQAKAESLFKAASLVESDEDFQEVVKAIADLVNVGEQSDLFVEKGASSVDAEEGKESTLVKALKTEIAKSNKK